MVRRIERALDCLLEHYLAACIVLALFILTFLGVGDAVTVSMLGLLLCAVGFIQRPAKVDLWVFLPLIIYNVARMASTVAAYGDLSESYGPNEWIYPLLYLLMACLGGEEQSVLKRLCVCWSGAVALLGVGRFASRAIMQGNASRLGGLLGNPNAMGIFLVVSWFALMRLLPEETGKKRRSWTGLLPYIEPVLLMALALTLSLGSFGAMVAGVLWLIAAQKRRSSWRETGRYACVLLAKASLGVGTGVLVYLAASRTGKPWMCLLLLAYGAAVVALWPKFGRFLKEYPRAALAISAAGAAVALVIIAVRPSSWATFAERLAMIRNGLGYLTKDPLFGVGPYRWRLLNLRDSDTYFNTWHIHNALLHVGVEFGWIAMAALVTIVVRFFRKKAEPAAKAEFTAYFVHNMMDTSFFYVGITGVTLLTLGEPNRGGKTLNGGVMKAFFGVLAVLFAYGLYCGLTAA